MSPPNPNFELSPCTPADIPGMIAIYRTAFAEDYFARMTLPINEIDPNELERWLTIRFSKYFPQPEYHLFKIADLSTGRVCAFIRWAYPYVFTAEEKALKKREEEELERKKKEGTDDSWPKGANLEALDKKFGALDRMREKNVNEEDTYGESPFFAYLP